MIAPTIGKALKLPLVYLVLAASIIQVIGYSLLSTLPESPAISASQYGYQIIAGFGCGINISLLILMTPFAVEGRDKGKLRSGSSVISSNLTFFIAVAMGAVAQFRVMGGVICLAIVTSVFNGTIRSGLKDFLSPDQIDAVLRSTEVISTFPPMVQDMTRVVFLRGYSLQFKILTGFAGGQILSSFLMWKKNKEQIRA